MRSKRKRSNSLDEIFSVDSDDERDDLAEEDAFWMQVDRRAKKTPRAPFFSYTYERVLENQNLQKSGKGFTVDSASKRNKNTTIDLNRDLEHTTRRTRNGKSRKVSQKLELDHFPVQYVTLHNTYTEKLAQERQKGKKGKVRRNSFDMAAAFKVAVNDPTNLRALTHDEHKKEGPKNTSTSVTQKEVQRANTLFDQALNRVDTAKVTPRLRRSQSQTSMATVFQGNKRSKWMAN